MRDHGTFGFASEAISYQDITAMLEMDPLRRQGE